MIPGIDAALLDRWEPVIGLEVHAQMATHTKMFCGCRREYGAPPNTHVCPVCLGYPGALPVFNSAALELALRIGVALGCRIRSTSTFARKNYFYPDLTKGYQISQFDEPLCEGGANILENLRTLCLPCHRKETAQLRRRLAKTERLRRKRPRRKYQRYQLSQISQG